MHEEKLTKSKYGEYLASLFGASFIAFALGVWLHNYFAGLAWVALVLGLSMHSYGMYKTYQRNR